MNGILILSFIFQEMDDFQEKRHPQILNINKRAMNITWEHYMSASNSKKEIRERNRESKTRD